MIGPDDDDDEPTTAGTSPPEEEEEEKAKEGEAAEEEQAAGDEPQIVDGGLEGARGADTSGQLETDEVLDQDDAQAWEQGFTTEFVEDRRVGQDVGFEAGNDFAPRSMLQSILPVGRFPEIAYNFIVSVGADIMGDFQSVEGVGYRIDPYTYNEGGRNHSPHMLPFRSPAEPQVATLRWGTVVWSTLYDWIKAVEVGKNFRRSVWIIQLSREGWPSRITRLGSAWPVEWSATRLSTQSSEWALEELKIAYEELNMVLTRAGDVG